MMTGNYRKYCTSASRMMPGRPRNPAITTVTGFTGNSSPVKEETELSTHRHKNPQAELMKIFQNQRMGIAMIRSSPKASRAGIKSVEKLFIKSSVSSGKGCTY